MAHRPPRVVIIGGGFAGLAAARGLRDAPVEVTLVDRRNFHLFQPLLYQVATGGLSPANIAVPLRAVLSKQKNARVLLDVATGFDVAGKRVLLEGGTIDYDVLVVATGSHYNYFGHPEWETLAPPVKSLEDALDIRARILGAFETAEREAGRRRGEPPPRQGRLGYGYTDADQRQPEADRALLTFVVVGGGPTGVEMAGAIGEVARHTLEHDFRAIRPADARIILVEALDRVLPPYPASLSRKAREALEGLGVEVRTSTMVTGVDEAGVSVRHGDVNERIDAAMVIWAAGVVGSRLGAALAEATTVAPDRAGRFTVVTDLSLPGHADIFVIGDLAAVVQDGRALPAVAPVALQEGAYVARTIEARLADGDAEKPFRYHDWGSLATIGRSAAVADLGRVRLSGFIGWITWVFVHLMRLAQFENRVLVGVQWAWNYFTRGRSARLITRNRE